MKLQAQYNGSLQEEVTIESTFDDHSLNRVLLAVCAILNRHRLRFEVIPSQPTKLANAKVTLNVPYYRVKYQTPLAALQNLVAAEIAQAISIAVDTTSKTNSLGEPLNTVLAAFRLLDNTCDSGNPMEIGKAQIQARSMIARALPA